MKSFYRLILLLVSTLVLSGWGFYGHKLIGEWSIYGLPGSMFSFYQQYKPQLKAYTVLPDVLKNSIPSEYCRHYIDLEYYDTLVNLNFNIDSCLEKEACFDRGILPFIIIDEFNKLITLFSNGDVESILRQSGVLSHYCSDLCVPLHTTANYNGQLTGQKGIHALWESYLLETHVAEYDLYGFSAKYESDVDRRILNEMYHAHNLVEPLLKGHLDCLNILGDKATGFYIRNQVVKQGYSQEFQFCFHNNVFKQIEGQLNRSIQLTSDLWFSAWILAGKPRLNGLPAPDFVRNYELKASHSTQKYDKRKHE